MGAQVSLMDDSSDIVDCLSHVHGLSKGVDVPFVNHSWALGLPV